MIATDGTRTNSRATRLCQAAAMASILGALALAAFLVARRVTGDVSSPLATALVVPTVAILVAWAWLVRLAWEGWEADDRVRHLSGLNAQDAMLWRWLPSIAILGFALALSFPGARFIDWLIWLTAFAAIFVGPSGVLRAIHDWKVLRRKESNDITVQDLKRYRAADGGEFIRGTLAAEFFSNQRTATLYAGFCPPFEHLPQVKAHAHSRAASVKVAQVLHNGVQLEVRLVREAKRNQVVTVEFLASERKTAS